jgi:hypothetical protein
MLVLGDQLALTATGCGFVVCDFFGATACGVVLAVGILVTVLTARGAKSPDELKAFTRIKDLNDKATQILIFLSFAMIAAVTLRDDQQKDRTVYGHLAVTCALQWWTLAIFPALVCVLPVKEFWKPTAGWDTVIWMKNVVLWISLVYLAIGATLFFRAL